MTEQGQLESVEFFLSHLVQAWRAVQLYPVGNPRIREAVVGAVVAAQKACGCICGASEPEADDRGDGKHDYVIIRVTREAFLFDEEPVAPHREGPRRLAEDLYERGVKFLWLRPGLSAPELEQLLQAVAGAENRDRFEAALEEADFEHAGLEIIDSFQLVDRTEATARMDMLSYLRAKQARRRAPLEDSDPLSGDLPEDEVEDISDLAEFFLEIAQGSEEKTQYLYNNLSDPRRLAETLTYLARIHPSANTGLEMPVDVVRQTLGHISDTIRQLPDEARASMVRNIAEAVLATEASVRKQVMDEAMAAEVGKTSLVADVCASLPDDVVAHLLSAHVRLHRGTANTISNFLDDFAGDGERRETIKRMITRELRESGDTREQEVVSLLEGEPRGARVVAKRQSPENRTERESAEVARDARARELALSECEFAALTEAAYRVSPEDDLERAVLNILGLRRAQHIASLDSTVWGTVHTALERAVDHGRFIFLANCLDCVRILAGDEEDGTARQTLEEFITRLAGKKYVTRIIRTLLRPDLDEGSYHKLSGLLRCIGERAYEELFELLAKERDRGIRRRLILAFIDLGEDAVYFLSRMIEHRHWYVVRNVAYLLGKLKSTAGLGALERVLHYPDIRVRREVLRAAASIRGPDAEGLLRRCLDDPEPAVRGLAAEWLGIMKAPGIRDEFRAMLRDNDRRLRSCQELAAGVVRALGRIGDVSDLPLLDAFKQHSKGLTLIRHAGVVEACDHAMAEIRRREEVSPASSDRERAGT